MVYLKAIINALVWYLGVFFRSVTSKENKNGVIIVSTNGIGDNLLFSAIIRYYRTLFPSQRIVILVRDAVASLYAGCPYVDEVISFDYQKFRKNIFYRFAKLLSLRELRFHTVINPVYTHDRPLEEMVSWACCDKAIGWTITHSHLTEVESQRAMRIYTKLIHYPGSEFDFEIKKHIYFLQALGVSEINHVYESWHNKHDINTLTKYSLDNEFDYIGIIPGVSSSDREWPFRNYLKLMQLIAEMRRNLKFILIGGGDERHRFDISGSTLSSRVLNLCGKTSLGELFTIFQRCVAVVGNDTGVLHLANFTDTPTISILGGGHYGRFMPYPDIGDKLVVNNFMDCYHCHWRCMYNDFRCISSISVDQVFQAFNSISGL